MPSTRYLGWHAERRLEPLRLLRPVRPDHPQPPRLRGDRRLRPPVHLRRAAQARTQDRDRLLQQARRAACRAERRRDLRAPRAVQVGPVLHRHAPLARRGRRGEGLAVEPHRRHQSRRRQHRAGGRAATSTSASTCRSRTPRCGCATPRASPTARRTDPYANFYFGGFGNNYVDRRNVKRYREYDSFPGFEINEISRPQLRAQHARVEPAAGGVRVARHAGLPPQVAAPGGVRLCSCGPNREVRACARATTPSALSST